MEFAVCIENTNYPTALEIRKLYQVLPDPAADRHQLIRIIDESGEDYLYPRRYFLPIPLSDTLKQALSAASFTV
ncbi:MAG: hypothetical protein HC910_13310 [Spirulinaceae cyanobacterium SM2_1_0]|nr:hypothetical protein [Spirulinaceae cyanobacterium SM2_1_0]